MHRTRSTVVAAGIAMAMAVIAIFAGGSPAQADPYDHLGVAPVSGGYYYVSNGETGYCMEVTDWKPNNGQGVRQNMCQVTWAQQFQLVSIGKVNGVPAWRLIPRFTPDKCLDVTNGVTVPGQGLQIWTCSPGWQQMFELYDVGGSAYFHTYQLRPVYNHWCVDVHDPYELAQLVEQPCASADDYYQHWTLSY